MFQPQVFLADSTFLHQKVELLNWNRTVCFVDKKYAVELIGKGDFLPETVINTDMIRKSFGQRLR